MSESAGSSAYATGVASSRVRDPGVLLTGGLLLLVPLAWVFVLVLREVEVFGSWPSVSAEAWIYCSLFMGVMLAAAIVVLLVGSRIIGVSGSRRSRAAVDTRWLWLFCMATLLGVAIMTYEFMVMRGYPLFGSAAELRIVEVNRAREGNVGSWLGAVGRPLISAFVAAVVLAMARWKNLSWSQVAAVSVTGIVLALYQARFEGGRSFLFILLAIAAVTFVLAMVGRARMAPQYRGFVVWRDLVTLVVVTSLYLGGILFYSGSVFVDRVEDRDEGMEASLQGYLDSVGAEVASGATRKPISGQSGKGDETEANSPQAVMAEGLSPLAFQLGMGWVYLTQGPNEFDRILDHSGLRHASGFYQFPQIAQLLSKVVGRDLRYDSWVELPSVGTYPTLAGSSYIDFGWTGGLIYAALIGAAMTAGLLALTLPAFPPIALIGPILFAVALGSPIMSLITNFWPAFLWIIGLALIHAWRGPAKI